MAKILLDATEKVAEDLTLDRLCRWHKMLFVDGIEGKFQYVGHLRSDAPMLVVSGRMDKPVIHFEAPPRKALEKELNRFLLWFNKSHRDQAINPLIRAGIAHFWFVTLHPFEDGNGRLARTIADLALAQFDRKTIRFYAMSAAILAHRKEYYSILEKCQRGGSDITVWLQWFLQILNKTLEDALEKVDKVIYKTRFWQKFQDTGLLPEQKKALNLLLDDKRAEFTEGISAAKYGKIARVSKATATRHSSLLLEKGLLVHLPGGGRSTRYRIESILTILFR